MTNHQNTPNNHLLYTLDFGSGGGSGITLTALSGVLPDGRWRARLDWTGAAGARVDVRVDGAVRRATPNDGSQVFTVRPFGSGVLDVTVCEEGSPTACSDAVTLDFTAAPRVPDTGEAGAEVLALE